MRKLFPLYFLLLSLPTMLFADIVYQGKRVESWPEDARPKFNNSSIDKPSFLLSRTDASQTKSHYAAPKGKIYSLTLLVDFSDKPAPVTVSDIEEWLNKEGFNRDGCNGSVRDYYLDVSNGQLDLTNEVFGWYRAKHPKSWYESLKDYTGSDSLMKEVFAYFDPQVFRVTTTTRTERPKPSTSFMPVPEKRGDKGFGRIPDGPTKNVTGSASRTIK